MHQTKLMILLSLNAVAILIVGVMIFSAINLNGGIELKVVGERSDEVSGVLEQLGLLADRLLSKIVVNVIVILVNYIVSKFFIFK